jgi:hypothetical protein
VACSTWRSSRAPPSEEMLPPSKPARDPIQKGVEPVAGGEAVQAQQPRQGGLPGERPVDVADAGDAGDEDHYQGHQLIDGPEVGVPGRADRDGSESLRESELAEVLQDDGGEAPAGEPGLGVLDRYGGGAIMVGSGPGHRDLRDARHGPVQHSGSSEPDALASTPSSTSSYIRLICGIPVTVIQARGCWRYPRTFVESMRCRKTTLQD